MATQQSKIILLAGAGALLFMSGKKKKKSKSSKKPSESTNGKSASEENLDDNGDEVFESEEDEVVVEDEDEDNGLEVEQSIISKYMDPNGRAQLGGLYQIKLGDTPLEICREALFGSREIVTSPAMRQAAIDLLVRIDCGPWNQAIYGVGLSKLTAGHAAIDQYWTQQGVSFDPIYEDNLERMSEGMAPSGAGGGHFALIWIPMINLDKFDMEGIVTTEKTYHSDGTTTVDPPLEIISMGFDNVSEKTVGCDLPEGDFRKTLIAN